MREHTERSGRTRLLTVLAWLALLSGLWLWAAEITDTPDSSGAGGGEDAASGRTATVELPPVHAPLAATGRGRPLLVGIASAGVRAEVLPRAAPGPPPPARGADTVAWYEGGKQPGATGVALLVGHQDTGTAPGAFHRLSDVRPGERVRVERGDGAVADFTVEEAETFGSDGAGARRAYGPGRPGRPELRLIACDGRVSDDRAGCPATVVVSAYLTAVRGR